MTHIEFINIAANAKRVAKVINEIISAERWSIGGSMVLEAHGKLCRDIHDVDLIFEFRTRGNAILAYQLLDRVLDTLGKEHKKSYENVSQDVWSVEFQTPLLQYPINVLFRERDGNILRYFLGNQWQSLNAVEEWKRKWNRDKDIEDLK